MKIKKLILIFFLLYGCATTESIISDGKLYSGMSKESLRNVLIDVYPSEDAFIPDSFSEYNYSEKKEIISGSSKKLFYVFKNVNKPIDCGLILCKYGDGTLVSWHYNLSNARNALTSNKNINSQQQPIIKNISSNNNKDHVDALNELIEDLKSGKIDEFEFNKKNDDILK
jgi:hypothetical protein